MIFSETSIHPGSSPGQAFSRPCSNLIPVRHFGSIGSDRVRPAISNMPSGHVSPITARRLADLRAAVVGGHTGLWLELSVVAIATIAAFLLGYFHAAAQPVDGSWAQIHMTAA